MNLLEDTLVLIYHYVTNYVTKTYLKNTTGIDASKLAAKSDLASLKAEIDKLDIGKLEPASVDLSKRKGHLSDIVKDDLVKQTVDDKLVAKVSNIDISGFAINTKYETGKSDLEKKISDADKQIPATSGLVTKNRLQC